MLKKQNEGAARKLGRPRDEELDQRILSVTLELLAQDGYDAMSIGSVAAAAGVSKPTIYRRWDGKEELTTSAVATLALRGPDTTGLAAWDAVVAELDAFHEAIRRPHGMALIGNVLVLEHRHPRLIELYRAKVARVRRSRIAAALGAARDAGQMRSDVDLDIVMNMLMGYYYAARVSGAPIDDGWTKSCVDTIRAGIET